MFSHTSTQSMNILTLKEIASDEKSWIVIAAFEHHFQNR